jgi:hypothetical protein
MTTPLKKIIFKKKLPIILDPAILEPLAPAPAPILVPEPETPLETNTRRLFLELAQPDAEGISRFVHKSEFIGKYAVLNHTNGCSWGRESSSLCKQYKLMCLYANGKPDYRFKCTDIEKASYEKDLPVLHLKGHTITAYKLCGLQNIKDTQSIRADIKNALRIKRCPVLGTSNPEIDHKNGRKNNPRVMCLATQKETDFQALSKAANDAKRQHCINCRITGQRFDAQTLGFAKSVSEGDLNYIEGPDGCVGCYWYDIEDFHLKISPAFFPFPQCH